MKFIIGLRELKIILNKINDDILTIIFIGKYLLFYEWKLKFELLLVSDNILFFIVPYIFY
jgi:hypothetical protein